MWQAFVGVRARRVDKYYHDLLAPDANLEGKKAELEELNHDFKWKGQIEKVVIWSETCKVFFLKLLIDLLFMNH